MLTSAIGKKPDDVRSTTHNSSEVCSSSLIFFARINHARVSIQELLDLHKSHVGGVSTITGIKDFGFRGRYSLEHMSPVQYDSLFRRMQALMKPADAYMPAMNEISYGWALLAFDLDCATLPLFDHDAERRRLTEVSQLARLFMQELEMHFTGYLSASCVVARNDVQRYRLMFPGVAYVSTDTIKVLVRLVRQKVFRTPLAAYFEPSVFDLRPTARMALRVHGTAKSPGGLKRKYRVATVLPDSAGNLAPVDRLSVRPSAEHYAALYQTPESSYLQAATQFARASHAGNQGVVREHEHYWKHSVLHVMFGRLDDLPPPTPRRSSDDLDEDDDDSDSIFGDAASANNDDDDDDDPGYSMLLLSRRLIVAECRGQKCALLLHGERADTATLHYEGSTTRTVEGLAQHQYTEEEVNSGMLLDTLEGPLISLFARQLRNPRIGSLLNFPLELFVYSAGLSPLEVGFDEDAARYTFQYRASQARRITHDTSTAQMAYWALGLSNKASTQFPIVNETVYRRCDEATQYCNDVFSDTLRRRNQDDLLVVQLKAGCGSGKTVFSLEYIGGLLRANATWTLLCVTPRAQLCSQLAVKIADITKVATHLYTNGAWPDDARACVVTLDSLVRTAAPDGVTRAPTIVLLDEVELSAHHLAASATMSNSVDGRLRTLETLLIMIARARRVIAMDAHFGFGASLFLSMIAVKRSELCLDGTMRYLYLEFERKEPVKFVVLADEGRRVAKVREDLQSNKRVIVFEPAPRQAEALAALFHDRRVLVVHGRTEADMKSEFASDPVKYLVANNVELLVHTTSVGVGVSIDTRYFDTSYVSYRPFLPDEAIVQGMYRARQLELNDGVRQININYDKRIRRNGWRLLSIPTVGDALTDFEQRLMADRELFKRYSALTRVSGFDARVVVDRTDIKTVFVAAMLAAADLAVAIQGYVCDTRLFDERNECEFEGVPSTRAELDAVSVAAKSVSLFAPLSELDGPRTQNQKRRLLKEIGYEFDAGAKSVAFMGRLELGMSHPSNLRRFAALLVYLHCSQVALRRHIIDILGKQTESMPLYQLNDARGITLGVETVVAVGAVKALGMDHQSLHMATPRNTVNVGVQCETTDGATAAFGEVFDRAQPWLRGERWAPCKRGRSVETRVRQFLNCYFGGRVCGIRSGISWDYRQIALSAELVPNYLRVAGLECPPEVAEYCAGFNGTWDRFLEAESNGDVQSSIY